MTSPSAHANTVTRGKPRPPYLRALGADDPPVTLEIAGETYARVRIFKHDFAAATALYEGPRGRVTCKFARTRRLLFIPLAWAGRCVARHESKLLRLLGDVPNVPALLGPVTIGGKPARHVLARHYVEGHPLARREPVSEDFFSQLEQTIQTMHRRRIAYVDLNKRENIIVGDDGRPHLIDFQISFVLPRGIFGFPLLWLFWILCASDGHHLRKHIYRHRRELLPPGAAHPRRRPPLPIRFWRCIATPFRQSRRLLLVALGVRKGRGRATTEHAPEDALKRELESNRGRETTVA